MITLDCQNIGTISFGPPQIGRRFSNNINKVTIARVFPPTGGVILIFEVSGRISFVVFNFSDNVVLLMAKVVSVRRFPDKNIC